MSVGIARGTFRVCQWVGLALALLYGTTTSASADRIADLTEILQSSKHDKSRMAAAVSLGRLLDIRALAPLVIGLRDSHRTVREVSAVALGKLGSAAALPDLLARVRDREPRVRRRVREAIRRIKREQNARKESPHTFITLASIVDNSQYRPTGRYGALLRGAMDRELSSLPQLTRDPRVARRFGIPSRKLDVAITRLGRVPGARAGRIECRVRVAISDGKGRLLSTVSSFARIDTGRRSRRSMLRLYPDVISEAVKGVRRELLKHLHRRGSS